MEVEKILKGKKIGNRYLWSREEIDFLIKNYRILSIKEISSKLGRSEDAVSGKAKRLNLKKGEVKEIEKKETWLGYNCEKRKPDDPTSKREDGSMLFWCYNIDGKEGQGYIGEGAYICKFCQYSGQICPDCGGKYAALTSLGVLCKNCYDKKMQSL
jgi:hypothetical protein